MNEFNEIIKNINNKILNKELQIYIETIIKSWFIQLNINDIKILSTMGTYIIIRICKLFISNDNYLRQLKKNNNQDIKSILLLLLPYINDEPYINNKPYINDDKINVYDKLTDLNELILTSDLKPSDYKEDRINILNTHFKYTNIGIGLIDKDKEIKLDDKNYGKLIYKILYHNFIGLNETLSIINGKLYVNWLNIYPLTENNYKDSNIYKNTINNIDTVINYIVSNNYDDLYDYNGLYIGEFYNVFRNIYYENIKKVKWLIYIINGKYIIQYLNNIFDFKLLLKLNAYEDLQFNDQETFNNKLLEINDNLLIWKNILLFFINNYSNRNILFKNIPNNIKNILDKFIINIDDGDDNDLKGKSKILFDRIKDNDIKTFLQNIEGSHLWNFIKESINIFKSTIYADYLIVDDKITNFLNFPNTNLNLKNIYNIAKSLSHKSTIKWELLPIKYSSLSINQQKNFWKKFNQLINYNEWINLSSNIKLEQDNIKLEQSSNNYDTIMKQKLNAFKKIKYDLVWDYLIKNGVVSDFQTNFKINDSIEYGDNRFKEIKIFFKNNINNYEEGYYYLTNKKYKDHIFRSNMENISLLQNLNNMKWYTFYAMDWISQIGFFHHYLNHRILYITGATGQGKSTQVPKLFMYGLKMLDYKNNGKVICTQPRIGPTNGNATRISDELGVPIEQYSYSFKDKIKSDNYYVQLTHSLDKHVKNNCNHLTLKVLTDGSLLTEIIKNPFLKEEIIIKDNLIKYSDVNKCDIIIIDEAHEHNTNMDLILTLSRQSCFINNDLKLIIMSATMDDDEPNFRSYYKIINDNLVYPLRRTTPKYFYKSNESIKSNNLFLYDSIYLDRRFHIAPPGQSTQYNILEYYEPNGDANKITKEILESSTFGDILIFENGVNEIIKRITILNKIIPNDVIALPYYSSLDGKYKLFIEIGLENNLKTLKIDKSKVSILWGEKYIESNDVPEGTYTRCIIVATNVAEASITLQNLKFVIDNGFSKVNSYDYELDITKLEPEEISEASRKQRKGRVGRVASGTIYYLYEKSSREKNKSKYKITQENFGYSLIKLLEIKESIHKKNETIISTVFDPNIYETFNKNNNDIKFEESIKEKLFYKNNLFNIIKKQYASTNYLNYWNNLYYSFMKERLLSYMSKFESGFDLYSLLDMNGLFYIIHPFENLIKRNILGIIISYNINNIEFDSKKIPDEIFSNMLINLNNKYLLVNFNNNNDNKIVLSSYAKTEFVNIIEEMDSYLDWKEKSIEDIIVMLTSKAYGSFNEVLEILTFIKTINGSIKNLFGNSKIPKNYNFQDNEIEYIYNIINSFKKSFSHFKIFEIKSYSYLENKYKYHAKVLVDKFLIDYEKNKLDPPSNKYTVKLWNKLSNSYQNGLLKTEKGFMKFIGDMFNLNDSDEIYNFRNYKEEIQLWAKSRNFKSKILIDFLEYYTYVLLDVLTIKKDIDPNKEKKDPLEKMEIESTSFKKSLTGTNTLEHIIRPFLHGNTFNIILKLKTNEKYKTISLLDVINSTKPNNTNLLFYFNKIKLEDNKVYSLNITNKIEIEWLFNILPFYYNPSNFKNEITKLTVQNKLNNYNVYERYGNLFDDFCAKISNKWSLHNIPFESTDLPILKEYLNYIKNNLIR